MMARMTLFLIFDDCSIIFSSGRGHGEGRGGRVHSRWPCNPRSTRTLLIQPYSSKQLAANWNAGPVAVAVAERKFAPIAGRRIQGLDVALVFCKCKGYSAHPTSEKRDRHDSYVRQPA